MRSEMPQKKALLIRISPELWTELRRLADSEFRSLNGQIEYLLREAVQRRVHPSNGLPPEPGDESAPGDSPEE